MICQLGLDWHCQLLHRDRRGLGDFWELLTYEFLGRAYLVCTVIFSLMEISWNRHDSDLKTLHSWNSPTYIYFSSGHWPMRWELTLFLMIPTLHPGEVVVVEMLKNTVEKTIFQYLRWAPWEEMPHLKCIFILNAPKWSCSVNPDSIPESGNRDLRVA